MKRITILKMVKILMSEYHLVGAPNKNIVQNQLT